MNKKGQEGVTLTTLLLIILGAVVVVVVILGATGFFDKVFEGTGQIPDSLQVVVTGCQEKATLGIDLRTDYCTTLREVEIDGKAQYVTCNYLETTPYLEGVTMDCGNVQANRTAYCINERLSNSTIVTGFDCKTWKESSGFVDNSGNPVKA